MVYMHDINGLALNGTLVNNDLISKIYIHTDIVAMKQNQNCVNRDIYNYFYLTAQTLAIKSIPSGPTYVKLGEDLTLDVTYNYNGNFGVRVTWSHDGISLVRKLSDGRTVNFNKRAFVKGEASLVLTNTERNDNGTYTVTVEADDVLKSAESINLIVIVQGKFFVHIMDLSIAWLKNSVWSGKLL